MEIKKPEKTNNDENEDRTPKNMVKNVINALENGEEVEMIERISSILKSKKDYWNNVFQCAKEVEEDLEKRTMRAKAASRKSDGLQNLLEKIENVSNEVIKLAKMSENADIQCEKLEREIISYEQKIEELNNNNEALEKHINEKIEAREIYRQLGITCTIKKNNETEDKPQIQVFTPDFCDVDIIPVEDSEKLNFKVIDAIWKVIGY